MNTRSHRTIAAIKSTALTCCLWVQARVELTDDRGSTTNPTHGQVLPAVDKEQSSTRTNNCLVMNPDESPALHQRPIHFTNGPLPTNISLDRFLITWHDTETGNKQALGDLSAPEATTNNTKPELYFRIAWDESGTFLLYFYLPLKIRAANKGIRDFYLVVPAEAIRRPDGLTLLEENEDSLSLRLALHGPSAVLMPTAGAKRPLSVQVRGLLLALKSLSQTPRFEVTFPRSDCLEAVLRAAAARVKGSEGAAHEESSFSLRSPQIDFEKTFSGREWGENEWDRYLIIPGETLQGEWNPLVQEAPPRYEDVVAEGHAGCGAEVGVGDGEGGGEELGDGERPGGGEAGDGERLVGGEQQQPRGEKDKGLLLDTTNAPYPPTLPTPSKATGHTQDPGSNRPAPLKRKAASPPPHPHPHAKPSPLPQPTPLPTTLLLTTLHRHLSPSSPPGSLSTFLPLPSTSQSVLNLGRSRCLFTDEQYARFFNGVAWLATLWPRRPDALPVLLPHAGRMMMCVRESDWVRFAACRVAAMGAALVLSGGQGVGKEHEERPPGGKRRRKTPPGPRLGEVNPLAVPPTRAAAALVGFIYVRIGEGADAFIVDDLLALQEVAVLLEQAAAAAGLRGAETGAQGGQGEPGERATGGLGLEHASGDAVDELERQVVAFTWQLAACVMLALFKAHERDWFAVDVEEVVV
ncbi:hypothetical protein IWZ01DRAFT_480390 [Phyllosticta capitalensis]